MNLVINGYNIFLILMVTFLGSFLFVPIVKKIANHIGAMDIPNERKVHSKPTPRLGGLAIFASFILGYILFAPLTEQMISILIGGLIIIILGICDDIKPVKARYKLLVQIIAALVVTLYGNIVLDSISIFGLNISFHAFSYPITIFFIISIINAINLIDGLDGLATGTCSIFFITISIIAFLLDRTYGLDIILCIITLGACLGFLPYNFKKASIFLGDTGSTFLGFMISIIALLGYKTATVTTLIIPIIILFLPILDTILAMVRRVLNHENIGAPDKKHIHHQLLNLNKSQTKTVLMMYGIDIIASAISVFYALGYNKIAIIFYIALLFISLLLIFKTSIIFDKGKK